MIIFLSAIHVIGCLILIVVILLQVGRGHGLTGGGFGGESTQTIFGTKTTTFMTRMTTAAAITFLVTSLTLDIFVSRRSKSLILDTNQKVAIPKLPEGVTVTTKDGEKVQTSVTTKTMKREDGRVVKTIEKKVVDKAHDAVKPFVAEQPAEKKSDNTN